MITFQFVSYAEVTVEITEGQCVLDEALVISYSYTLTRLSRKRQADIVETGKFSNIVNKVISRSNSSVVESSLDPGFESRQKLLSFFKIRRMNRFFLLNSHSILTLKASERTVFTKQTFIQRNLVPSSQTLTW